jgi:hypothetical protein
MATRSDNRFYLAMGVRTASIDRQLLQALGAAGVATSSQPQPSTAPPSTDASAPAQAAAEPPSAPIRQVQGCGAGRTLHDTISGMRRPSDILGGPSCEAAAHSCRQVVLVAAGMDSRAWRLLPWVRLPEGEPALNVFELDTGTAEGFKTQVLGRIPQPGDGYESYAQGGSRGAPCTRVARSFAAVDLASKEQVRGARDRKKERKKDLRPLPGVC